MHYPRPLLPPKWVFFDVDGTLTDSVPLVTAAFADMVAELYGREQVASDFIKYVGPPLADSMRDIDPQADEERVAHMIATYRAHYLPRIGQTPLYPGITEMLETLAQAGVKMAVATSKMEKYARPMLEGLGIDRYFSVMCGAGPEPESAHKAAVVARAIELSGVADILADPCPVVMVGDRIYDIEGAAQNGLPAMLVTWAGSHAPGEEEHAFAQTGDPAAVAGLLGLQ